MIYFSGGAKHVWRDRRLWAVLAIAAGARFLRLGGDLPYVFHYDEPTLVNCAVWLLQHGTLNPHFFNYPTGLIYLLGLLYAAALGIGLAVGRFADWGSGIAWLASGTYPRPAEGGVLYFYPTIGVPALYLIARGVSALAGIAAVAAIYALARRLELGRWAALLAAFMMAVSPLAVENSRYATTDMVATFLSMLAFAAILRCEGGRLREWVIAGALAGLAAGFKYNAGLVVVVIPLLVAWRWRADRAMALRGLVAAGVAAVVVFLLTTPYSILDAGAFLHDLGYEFRRISTPRVVVEGDVVLETSAAYKVSHVLLWNGGIFAMLAFLVGAIRAVRERRFSTTATVAWVCVTVLPMLDWRALYPRYLLLAWPPIVLLIVIGIRDLLERLSRLLGGRVLAMRAVTIAILALVLGPGLYNLALRESRFLRPDPRIEMTRWIETSLPAGTTLVSEKDGPFPNKDRFTMRVVDLIGRASFAEYRSQGVRYLALSGQEKRLRDEAPYAAVLENLADIRRDAQMVWSSGRYAILRVPPEEWEEAADAILSSGDLAGARRIVEERLAEGGSGLIHPWKRLAELSREMGDTATAVTAYRRALDLDPDDMEILLGAATLAIDVGDWDEAVGLLARARSHAPGDPLVNHNMAVARLYRARERVRRGEMEEARTEWGEARLAAETSARFAPGDPRMTGILEQVERMGARWGFRAGP